MGMPQSEQDHVNRSVVEGRVPDALATIEKYADLRAADQPTLSREALKALAGNVESLRDLVASAVSPSVSVRRFARKNLPKVGSPAARPLLFLALETVDPLRPVPEAGAGLLGSFDGFASPVGASIRRLGLSLELPAPPAFYSPGMKLAREALENVHFLLAAVDPTGLVLFHEICEGMESSFRYGGAVSLNRQWPGSEVFLATWAAMDGQGGLGKCKALPRATREWIQGRLLMDGEDGIAPALEAVRKRWLDLPEVNRASARRYLRLTAVKLLFQMPKEERLGVLALADDHRKTSQKTDDAFYNKYLDEFLGRFPGELEASRSATATGPAEAPKPEAGRPAARRVGTAAAKGVERPRKGEGEPVSGAIPSGEPFVPPPSPVPGHAATAEDMVNFLFVVAGEAGQFDLRRALATSLTEDQREWLDLDDEPEPSTGVTPAEVEAIRQAWAFMGALESDLDEMPVNEAALRAAPWQAAVGAVTARCAESLAARLGELTPAGFQFAMNSPEETPEQQVARRIRALVLVAAPVLTEQALDDVGRVLSPDRGRIFRFDYDLDRTVLQALEKRALFPAHFLYALFQPDAFASGDKPFQVALGRLYARADAESHEMARRTVERIGLPRGDEYYKRTHVHAPYQWVTWAAWKRADAEMLALTMERCCMSYHTARSMPQVPEAPPCFVMDNCAPCTLQAPGVGLNEVWNLVRARCPHRVPAIVRNALATAEIEDFPRRLLQVIASCDPPALQGTAAEVASLLESSQAMAATAAAAILSACPDLAAPGLDGVLEGLERGVNSTAAGLVKQATAALAAVGRAHARATAPAQELLCRVLDREVPALVEQALKSLHDLRQGSGPPALSAEARARIEHLVTTDPKRFGKPAARLLS